MVWSFWYSSWLVYIVHERPMSTGKTSGLYFWCGLYIFWCTPGLCPLHTAPLSHVIAEHDVEHHLYADDKQIYISLFGSEALDSLTDLKSCVTDVFTWLTNSKLKLNPSKAEFIIIGSKNQREQFKDLFPILLLDHDTLPKAFVRNLGFIFYCDFNFKRQISQTCKICIRDFRRIRK